MSTQWWEKAKTTQGHGIFSQYKPEHAKEWIVKETRRQERSTSPDKSQFFNETNSLHRSSLHIPIDAQHIEHRHHAYTKTLEELRHYQQPPPSGGLSTTLPTDPSVVTKQPLKEKYLPHLAHHHHFGWNPPTPQSRIAVVDSKINFYKMGNAQTYNHDVYSKASLITTRKA